MKARTCNQSVALLMRKFGLPAVQAAVEMAVELSKPMPQPKKRSTGAGKTRVVAAAASGETPERFEK